MRGRVLARDRDVIRVRTATGDQTVAGAGAGQPGDLVEVGDDGAVTVVRAYPAGDYPEPGSEVARLSLERQAGLVARARVLAEVRAFFAERGFLEVEAPLMVPSPGLEVHLRAVRAGDGYLITSPEYQLKRLIAGGLEQIYTICRCFRADEEGRHHATEFTMLEWYRAWSGLDSVMADTEELVVRVADRVRGSRQIAVDGRAVSVEPPWPRFTVAEAMREFAEISVRGDEPAEELATAVRAAGIDPGSATAWDDLFYSAFVTRVEPALAALGRAVFVTDWPARLSALARAKPGDPRVVERFELYAGGLELANAFGELTDAAEQRRRFSDDLDQRRQRGLEQYPVDEKFLAALVEGLPPCAGIALGIDRLVMLLAGAGHIREVSAFTADEL